MTDASLLQKAKNFIQSAKAICVLTGAGISAASGIKTFRDAGGLWEDHSIEQVATPEGFQKDPALVWRFYNARRKAAAAALPNAGHTALVHIEQSLRERYGDKSHFTVVTQNIDGLHQEAGNHHVIELHGSLWQVRCSQCNRLSKNYPLELPIPALCKVCQSLLRPHVIWFGETLEEAVLESALDAVQRCDLLLVVGTSAVVQPAASFPLFAGRRGIPIIEINPESTPASGFATLTLHERAEIILPRLISDHGE